jgi:hypothetical protein
MTDLWSLDSRQHLQYFFTLLDSHIPFCILRPGDGEYSIIIGKELTTIDNWHFNGTSVLKDDLTKQLHIASINPNTYIGIPCQGCNRDMMNYFMTSFNMNKNKTTYANVFCNSNWKTFINKFKDNNLPFYYIGPKITSTTHTLTIIEQFEVDPLLVDKWDTEKTVLTTLLMTWISSRSGIFCFSIGPISKIWASQAFEAYPSNTYLDVGSAFDYDLKGSSNRIYTDPTSYFSQLDCKF